MPTNRIFDTDGKVSVQTLQNSTVSTAFVTLGALNEYIVACAPASGINIQQPVDYAVTKALDGDYLVSSFGMSPVAITINGLSLYNGLCPAQQGLVGNKSLEKFYNEHNVDKKPKERISVGLSRPDGHSQVFKCVMVNLVLDANHKDPIGTGTYTLQMLGVQEA